MENLSEDLKNICIYLVGWPKCPVPLLLTIFRISISSFSTIYFISFVLRSGIYMEMHTMCIC